MILNSKCHTYKHFNIHSTYFQEHSSIFNPDRRSAKEIFSLLNGQRFSSNQEQIWMFQGCQVQQEVLHASCSFTTLSHWTCFYLYFLRYKHVPGARKPYASPGQGRYKKLFWKRQCYRGRGSVRHFFLFTTPTGTGLLGQSNLNCLLLQLQLLNKRVTATSAA